jgi:anthranilate phosphoribosyltransferase
VEQAVDSITRESVAPMAKADFLCRLALKGETIEEIAAFARALRARAVEPPLDPVLRGGEILDVVGTGGDRLSTFNISTTVAILAAAAGAHVAKHGNRASTSPIGSADVMEALGIPFDLGPKEAAAALSQHSFAYFFAPKYHPAFRHIVPARKLCAERGQATIFNFLGPLLNPARPSAMLVGVARPALCSPLARVLQSLGVRHAMVVSGTVTDSDGTRRHLDEVSPLGPTLVAEFGLKEGFREWTLDPGRFPLQAATLADLRGGDRQVNASIIRQVLCGEDRGPRRDAVLLNAAAAFHVAGLAPNLEEGWSQAAKVIDSGLARKKFEDLVRR